MELTSDQAAALEKIKDFIATPTPGQLRAGQRFFLLTGKPGTGKTTLMSLVSESLSSSMQKMTRWTAPTNKAAKVLSSKVGEARTIYSLLGLKLDKKGEIKVIKEGRQVDLSEVKLIIVDEASMINSNLLKVISTTSLKFDIKILFIGDDAQLPPVGEEVSPVWKLDIPEIYKSNLDEVVRHKGKILSINLQVREEVFKFLPQMRFTCDPYGEEASIEALTMDSEEVLKVKDKEFYTLIYNAAEQGLFLKERAEESAKIITWTNAAVAKYNGYVRTFLFGDMAKENRFIIGDKLILTSPVIINNETIFSTDTEVILHSYTVIPHPKYNNILVYELTVSEISGDEEEEPVSLLVLHQDSEEIYNQKVKALAESAKINHKLWETYWNFQEDFHNVQHAYAITSHRSQGSTYKVVFADSGNILMNRNRKEAFQCLFVALSRPTTKLYIL